MNENIKVCPQCDAEYFAHAQKCSSCEVELVLPDEVPAAHAHSHDHDHDHGEGGIPWPEGPSEVLMEASLEVLEEMGSVLNDNQLPYEIYEKPHVEGTESEEKAKSCQAGQSEYAIVVPKVHLNDSIKITEEHWYKLHPEQFESDQRASRGLCPACATELKGNPSECPDCGLNLAGAATDHGGDCC